MTIARETELRAKCGPGPGRGARRPVTGAAPGTGAAAGKGREREGATALQLHLPHLPTCAESAEGDACLEMSLICRWVSLDVAGCRWMSLLVLVIHVNYVDVAADVFVFVLMLLY